MTEAKEELNGSKVDESEIWDTLNQDIGEIIHEDEEESKDAEPKTLERYMISTTPYSVYWFSFFVLTQ